MNTNQNVTSPTKCILCYFWPNMVSPTHNIISDMHQITDFFNSPNNRKKKLNEDDIDIRDNNNNLTCATASVKTIKNRKKNS